MKIDLDIDIVAILFWGRSGSYFVGSLLDNHKSILTIPASYLMSYYGKDGIWATKLFYKLGDIDEMLRIIFDECKGMFDGSKDRGANLNHLGDNADISLKVDKKIFSKYIKDIAKEQDIFNRKAFFIALHYAYEMTLGNDISDKTLINYQLHTPAIDRIDNFMIDFPNAKYIGTYREPVRALYSHIRHHRDYQIEDGFKDFKIYDTVYNGRYLWYYEHQLDGWMYAKNKFNLNLLPIQLETLHKESLVTVKKIANFLTIDFEDTLMQSTFCGLKFWGDPKAAQKIDGFSKSHPNIANYSECFTKYDTLTLHLLVGLKYKEYQYLLQDNEQYIQLLYNMIEIPTKIEQDAINNAKDYDNYLKAMQMYHKRVLICRKFLDLV